MSQPFLEFERPPIVELVLGVQFAPLSRLTSGRLHVAVRQARITDTDESVLLVQTTVCGPIGRDANEDLAAGLALGHSAAVRIFFSITSAEAHAHWRLKS